MIVIITISIIAWILLRRRRRRNEEIRAFLVASPEPFSQYRSSAPPTSPSASLTTGSYTPESPLMPQPAFMDSGTSAMAEVRTKAPAIARKKPVPFLDIPVGSRQNGQTDLTFTSSLVPAHAHSMVNVDPFADPARNPFDDPVPKVPAVLVLPATPLHDKRYSAVSDSSISSSKVCQIYIY